MSDSIENVFLDNFSLGVFVTNHNVTSNFARNRSWNAHALSSLSRLIQRFGTAHPIREVVCGTHQIFCNIVKLCTTNHNIHNNGRRMDRSLKLWFVWLCILEPYARTAYAKPHTIEKFPWKQKSLIKVFTNRSPIRFSSVLFLSPVVKSPSRFPASTLLPISKTRFEQSPMLRPQTSNASKV